MTKKKRPLREDRLLRAEAKLELTQISETKEYLHEGIPVLTAEFSVPSVGGLTPRARARLNAYCGCVLRECMRYAEKTLYPLAAQTHAAALAEARLLPPFSLALRGEAQADQEKGVVTIRTELTEKTGGEAVTLRREEAFSLSDGWPILKGFLKRPNRRARSAPQS